MISYIVPHRNRVELLDANLRTLLAQTVRDFEVVIVDNSDLGHALALRNTVSQFRAMGMTVKVVFVDPSKHEFSHSGSAYGPAFNPALSQNIGVRKAKGDIICLTSPEVINAKTNVEYTLKLFEDGRSHFILGWIDERPLSGVGPLGNGITVEQIKTICRVPGHGAMCRDDNPARPWLPINYFLGFLRRDDFVRVGGIDERFMRSVAWEDNFFAHCCEKNGFPAEFVPAIAGIHLSHPRGYQMDLNNDNKRLWLSLETSASVANSGYDWGAEKYIVGEF